MRKFSNINKVTIAKYAIVGWQVILTSMFVVGFIRVVVGLIMGEFAYVSIGTY
jgi:hypothetical protein